MLAERIRLMETDLERIKGVHSARIRAEGGEISEIHVVADAARRPKMIVRDVVTTLFARYGVRVPHQRVSVAGSAPDPVVEPRPPASGTETEVQIASVHLTCEGEDFRATVELRDGQRAARATADAIATRANQSRVVAEAALEALRKLTGTLPPTQIEEVRSVELGDLPVVLVRVVVFFGPGAATGRLWGRGRSHRRGRRRGARRDASDPAELARAGRGNRAGNRGGDSRMSHPEPVAPRYLEAGVSLERGRESVRRIRERVRATLGPRVESEIGAFAGFFSYPEAGSERLLVAAWTAWERSSSSRRRRTAGTGSDTTSSPTA